jgi:hypothetical protein
LKVSRYFVHALITIDILIGGENRGGVDTVGVDKVAQDGEKDEDDTETKWCAEYDWRDVMDVGWGGGCEADESNECRDAPDDRGFEAVFGIGRNGSPWRYSVETWVDEDDDEYEC